MFALLYVHSIEGSGHSPRRIPQGLCFCKIADAASLATSPASPPQLVSAGCVGVEAPQVAVIAKLLARKSSWSCGRIGKLRTCPKTQPNNSQQNHRLHDMLFSSHTLASQSLASSPHGHSHLQTTTGNITAAKADGGRCPAPTAPAHRRHKTHFLGKSALACTTSYLAYRVEGRTSADSSIPIVW